MRDFTFYTSTPLTAKACFDNLHSEIKNVRGSSDPNEIQIFIGGKSRSFLWFYNERFEDYVEFYESQEALEEEKRMIPIEAPYLNHFETHRSIDAKRVIKVLMNIYPELYISADDLPEWYGTAQEYLDTEFDY
ncbi:MAG: hypothetical protein IJY50_06565 [Clostridia bacterium]|nr:hypothetical protein [Clostridia bacterium]